jgi:hypothetical protein
MARPEGGLALAAHCASEPHDEVVSWVRPANPGAGAAAAAGAATVTAAAARRGRPRPWPGGSRQTRAGSRPQPPPILSVRTPVPRAWMIAFYLCTLCRDTAGPDRTLPPAGIRALAGAVPTASAARHWVYRYPPHPPHRPHWTHRTHRPH